MIDVRGKKVISTPATCTATNIALKNAGAEIVWADVDSVTGNIDINSVYKTFYNHENVVAIACVHYGGALCDKRLFNLELPLIEDCAHRFNSSLGGYECYSFQAIKFMTTVDGGALVCPNDVDRERARLMRWFGIDRKAGGSMRCMNPVYEKGFKFHMNDVNATIGIEQLKYTENNVNKHKENAKRYCESFDMEYRKDSDYWLFVIHVNDRDEFIEYMNENGVMTSTVHGRNDLHPIFKRPRKHLPGVDSFYKTQVAIPVGWWLTDNDIDKITELVKKWKSLH